MSTLTGGDLDQAIDDRIRDREAAAYLERHRLPDPGLPTPGTPDHDKMIADERKLRERVAAAEEAEAALLAERQAEEERKRIEWEANAPKRAKAQQALVALDVDLARVEADREKLLRRRREVYEEAHR
jgi:hypothetical protein